MLSCFKTPYDLTHLSNEVDIDSVVNEMESSKGVFQTAGDESHEVLLCNRDDLVLTQILRRSIERRFSTWFESLVKRPLSDYSYRTQCWALSLGLKPGMEMSPHYHRQSHFTSVLYLTPSTSPLILMDSRQAMLRGYPESIANVLEDGLEVLPEVGLLITFPSFVTHYVDTTLGDLRRYSFVVDHYVGDKDGLYEIPHDPIPHYCGTTKSPFFKQEARGRRSLL